MSLSIPFNLMHLRLSQRWPKKRVRHSQLCLLRRLVGAAQRDVPLYRDLYGSANLSAETIPDLDSLDCFPVVTKDDIKANFPDRIVSRRFEPRRLYPVATSGTSDRAMSFQDEAKRDWDRSADLLMGFQCDGVGPHRRRMVIPPDACYERCGVDDQGLADGLSSKIRAVFGANSKNRGRTVRAVLATIVRDYIWRIKFMKSLGVDGTVVADEKLAEYVRALRAWQPETLSAFPFYLFVIAKFATSRGDGQLARKLRPAGGKASPVMIREIEAAFGGKFRENYGSAELGTISCDCKSNRRQRSIWSLWGSRRFMSTMWLWLRPLQTGYRRFRECASMDDPHAVPVLSRSRWMG